METDVNKITKQPSYRFAGYTEAWEQRKLGEVGTTYTGLSGKTKEDFGHGNGKFVTYMNVFSNAVGVLDMTEAVEIDNSQNKVLFGDVLFTTSSETPEEVGMSSVWLGNAENTYLNSFCFGYRPIVEFNPYYLAYMLRSSTMRKKITFLAQGISRYNISKNKMMEIEIPIPSMAEQKRIGEYFRNLDNLITLHQRKLEVLKEQKKTYLKLLFPAKGQTKPALRFAGFEDEWEQQKASEIFYSVSDKNHVDLPVLSASQEHGMVKRDEIGIDIKYDKASVKTYKRVKPGQFVIHLRSFQGGFAHSDIEGITSPAYTVIDFSKSNKHFDLFWKEVFTSQNFIKRLETVTYGIRDGRSISFSDFSSLKLQCPSLPEQEAIGSFFQDLDKAIAKQEEKVNQLKESKQTLLRKMFI